MCPFLLVLETVSRLELLGPVEVLDVEPIGLVRMTASDWGGIICTCTTPFMAMRFFSSPFGLRTISSQSIW